MCKPEQPQPRSNHDKTEMPQSSSINNNDRAVPPLIRKRRGKRDKASPSSSASEATTASASSSPTLSKSAKASSSATTTAAPLKSKRRSSALQKHGQDAPSGGIASLLPSLIGVSVLGCAWLAKSGFRGRASVAGIDLGTTNSVVCIQAPAKGVGEIECVVDPASGSNIVPSVVSFLAVSERPVGPSSKTPSLLHPHPSAVVVGHEAKKRIDSHPHHTLYNAKRVLGRTQDDPAVQELTDEVEFAVIVPNENDDHSKSHDDDAASSGVGGGVAFQVPDSDTPIWPAQVGSYVVNHLMQITQQYLGHDNVKSAVICVPAKFDSVQRQATHHAFKQAGVKVARVLEEPTAAALAYGLHRKEGVDYILVYDIGGGTLDVSLLHVSDGFVDVMGSDGDDRLGGADFDAAVAHVLLDHPNGKATVDRVSAVLQRLERDISEKQRKQGVDLEQALSQSCPVLSKTPLCTASSLHTIGEQLKIGLSAYASEDVDALDGDTGTDDNADAQVEASCMGLPSDLDIDRISDMADFCSSLEPVALQLTLAEYNKAVRPLLDRSTLPVQRLLRDLDLTEADMDEVVMVGGTSRMPQIRALVQKTLPSATLNTHIDPDITVAYGAASVID